jgi:hypothetical protein
VLAGVQTLEGRSLHRAAFCLDAKTILDLGRFDFFSAARAVPEGSGACFVCSMNEQTPFAGRFSSVRVEDGCIVEVEERVKLSDLINCGMYLFPSAQDLRAACLACLNAPESSTGLFASAAVRWLLQQRKDFMPVEVPKEAYTTISTPAQLRSFITATDAEMSASERLRFRFDLDTFGLDGMATATADFVRQVKARGHAVLLTTSSPPTQATLKRLEGLPYDELRFNEPEVDVIVDNRAVASWNIARELGWPTTEESVPLGGVMARSFHSVTVTADQVLKTAQRDGLRGEAAFYRALPPALQGFFPRLLDVRESRDNSSMTLVLERVRCVTFSQLAVSHCVTSESIRALLRTLHTLHSHAYPDGQQQLPHRTLCSNYADKVEERFKKNRAVYEEASGSADVAVLAQKLIDFLRAYEGEGRCMPAAFIHGDPVFSNVLSVGTRSVKLIDMRGLLGGALTTQGDLMYDLSKVFQSLCGYDFMLLGREITGPSGRFLDTLRLTFWEEVNTLYPSVNHRDVRILTAQHLFSILPLHECAARRRRFLRTAQGLADVEGL